jgi:hypothetical protein
MSAAMGKYELWRRRMGRYQRSGLTVAEFCASEGVSAPSFYQWRKRFAQVSAHPQDEPVVAKHRRQAVPAFQQLALATQAGRVVVELGSGVRLELPAENVELVRAVVAELVRAESRQRGGSC